MIRSSTEDDCEAIARVHVASWQSTYRGQIPDEYLNALSVPTRTQMWKQLLAQEGYRVLVIEQSGEINGFVSFGPSLDRDAPANQGEVYAIYLLAKTQGSGAGKALWDAAISELRSLGFLCITLWVLDTNFRARHFYEKMGCTLDGASKSDIIGGKEIVEVRYRLS